MGSWQQWGEFLSIADTFALNCCYRYLRIDVLWAQVVAGSLYPSTKPVSYGCVSLPMPLIPMQIEIKHQFPH